MFRRLQLLILAVVLDRRGVLDRLGRSCSSWSTSALLVGGGSYILTRLGLSDLEAGYAVSQLTAHVGDRLRVTYTLRNTGRLPKPWLEVHNPTTLPGGLPGRALSPAAGGRSASWLVRTTARAARPLPDRAAPDPDRRPVRVLRGIRGVGQGITLVVYPQVDALPLWKLPPASIEGAHASPERTLQTTPLATTVRPYAPGDSMNRIHWRTTARTGEIQVKEFDLEQTADAWIFLDLDAAVEAGSGDDSTTEVARPRRRVDRRQGAGREPGRRADRQRRTG